MMVGMFCALDMIVFYVFFEGVLIPMFLIIGVWGGARRVRYWVECLADALRCVVEDEGEGFDPGDVPDPLSPENLTREGGRGMFLIGALMRDLRIENTGHGMRVEFLCGRE